MLEALESEIGPDACQRYFRGSACLRVRGTTVEVVLASEFLARNLERRFAGSLRRAAAAALDAPESSPTIEFRVDASRGAAAPASESKPGVEAKGPDADAKPSRGADPASTGARSRARQSWRTLDDYIVGRSNRFAFSAAEQVAAGDRNFSPLFIHGGCGMGKTHLLQGLAERYRRAHPGARVRVMTAEAFTNEFITSMREQSLDAFRQKYRSVDLLCIDDVHFIANKRKTQLELLHTFDAVVVGGLVALASDEHPNDIEQINTGLISRFAQGATVHLAPPDDELRRRILHTMTVQRGLRLDDEALAMLSEHAGREAMRQGRAVSVRDLIGSATQVEAVARLLPDLDGASANGVALVRAAMGLTSGPDARAGSRAGRTMRPVRLDLIIDRVCERLGVTHEEFASTRRSKPVVLARALTVHLAKRLTNHSYPEITRAMARPNHSSIITMHNRIRTQIDQGETTTFGSTTGPIAIRDLVEQLEHLIQRDAVHNGSKRTG